MGEYRKTYLPLILWCLALVPVMLGTVQIAQWLDLNDRSIVALTMVAVVAMVLVLFWMVWRGEYVYWISGGPSFEDARAAGSRARREYAWKHLLAMLKSGSFTVTLLAAECLFGVHSLIMVLSTGMCIIWVAVSANRIRWGDER